MAVQTSGVKLELQGYQTFLQNLGAANAGMGTFGASAATASKGLVQFGIASQQLKIDTLTTKIAHQHTQLGILYQKLGTTSAKYGENSIEARSAALAVDKMDASIRANSSSLGIQKGKLDAMKAAEAEAEAKTKQLGSAITTFSGNLTTSGGKVSAWENITTGAFRKVGAIAVEGFAQAGRAIVGFLGDSLGVAGDFQASIGRFESITGPLDQAGLSAEDFSKKFIQMGMDTQFSAQEASSAAAELAKGGVSVGEIMGGATEATLALATAGELGLAPAAGIVAKQLGVWRDQGVGASDVANLLSQAANASTVNVDDLAIGLANVGGVAKVAGLSFEETVTTMALISPGFSSASDAGTSFKAFLNNLQPTTVAATTAMKDLGLFTDETGSVFYDAKGEFVGMQTATELLHNATKGLTEEERSLKLETIFGSDAQRAAALIAQDGAIAYDKTTTAMEGMGTASEQAAKRNVGFNFALDQLKGSLETAQIVIGSKFLPMGEALINNFLIPAVNATIAVANALEQGLTFAVNNAVPIVAGLTAAAIAYFAPAVAATVATSSWGLALVLAASQAVTAALSFAAVAIPLAAIAISVAAIAFAFVDFNKKVTEGRDGVRELAKGYQIAVDALDRWQQASPTVKAQTKAQADEVLNLKTQLDSAIERQSAWYSFLDSSSSEQRQIEQIVELNNQLKELAPAFQVATVAAAAHEQQLALQVASFDQLEAEATGATGALVNFSAAEEAELAVAKLSTEEKEAFNKQIADIRANGPGTYDSYLQSFVDYTAGVQTSQAAHNVIIAGLETELAGATTATQVKSIQDKIDAANASYLEQQKTAAIAYGQEAAAQRAHLGQMLIDYATAKAEINGVGEEKIAEMTTLLANEYGVQQSLSDRTFTGMADDIDAWAASGGVNSQKVVADLAVASDQAVETQRTMDALTGEYTAELIQNFDDGTTDADELAKGIANIPRRVNIEVNTNYTSSGSTGSGQYRPVESYATGTDRVSHDMLAQIHKDEAVLNTKDAELWRELQSMRGSGLGNVFQARSTTAPQMFGGAGLGASIGGGVGQSFVSGLAGAITQGRSLLAPSLAGVRDLMGRDLMAAAGRSVSDNTAMLAQSLVASIQRSASTAGSSAQMGGTLTGQRFAISYASSFASGGDMQMLEATKMATKKARDAAKHEAATGGGIGGKTFADHFRDAVKVDFGNGVQTALSSALAQLTSNAAGAAASGGLSAGGAFASAFRQAAGQVSIPGPTGGGFQGAFGLGGGMVSPPPAPIWGGGGTTIRNQSTTNMTYAPSYAAGAPPPVPQSFATLAALGG